MIWRLSFLSAVMLHAATYYVDSATGSDANSGTILSAPWRTLAKANVRIPMKWGTDSDASGAASGRSDAGYSYDLRSAPLGSRFLWLVRAIAIGIISFPSSSSRLCFGIRVPIEVGRDFDQRWGTVSTGNGAQFRTKWGAVSTKVGQPIRCPTGGQSISGSDGSAGPTSVFGTEFAVCNQRFSISSILRRTWSQ